MIRIKEVKVRTASVYRVGQSQVRKQARTRLGCRRVRAGVAVCAARPLLSAKLPGAVRSVAYLGRRFGAIWDAGLGRFGTPIWDDLGRRFGTICDADLGRFAAQPQQDRKSVV